MTTLQNVQVANVSGLQKLEWQRQALEDTRAMPGFVLVAPFSLLRKLNARLMEEERLGRRACLPLPIGPIPDGVDQEFFALPHAVLQLTEASPRVDWAVPMQSDEAVLGHATLTSPLSGVAAFIARVAELPTPKFDVSERERIAEALADALLAMEKLP